MVSEEDLVKNAQWLKERQLLKDAADAVISAWLCNRGQVEWACKQSDIVEIIRETLLRLFERRPPEVLSKAMSEGLVQAILGVYYTESAQDVLVSIDMVNRAVVLMMAGKVINRELDADKETIKKLVEVLEAELRAMTSPQDTTALEQAEALAQTQARHTALMADVSAGLDRMRQVEQGFVALTDRAVDRLRLASITNSASNGAPYRLQ